MKRIEGTIEATPEELEKMSEKLTGIMGRIVLDMLNRGEEIIPKRRKAV